MAFRNKQQAIAAYEQSSRENSAYHHALVASMKGELKRIGSVKDGKDSYTWYIAFTPQYFSAIIVQVFKSSINRDKSIRVFWLMDWKRPATDGYLWDPLYTEAQRLESQKLKLDNHPFPSSDPAALIEPTCRRGSSAPTRRHLCSRTVIEGGL